jgi:cytochrome c6
VLKITASGNNFGKKMLSSAAAAGAALTLMTTPFTALANPDLELGADVFNGNCAACHNGGGNTVKPGYTLEKDAINKYLETPVGSGLNVTNIIYQIQNGKNAMPAWADRLDDEEIESVAAYVYSQASNDKW